MSATYVYRLLGRDGRLLYVGMTKNMASRMKDHQRQQAWAAEIATCRVQRYRTREAARAAEVAAIRSEGPLYNTYERDRQGEARRGLDEAWAGMTQDERNSALITLDRLSGLSDVEETARGRSMRGAMMSVAAALRDGRSAGDGLEAWYGARMEDLP